MTDKTPIKMLHDRVLVELDRDVGERRSSGGIVVPATGLLPAQGAFPTLIQWLGETHPSSALPDSGCRVESVTVRCRGAARRLQPLRRLGLALDSPVAYVESESTRISAVLRTPRGVVLLPEAGPLE